MEIGEQLKFDYTSDVQEVTLPTGQYKFECWGAQGGQGKLPYLGGKGGYSTGIINLQKKTTLYIYVGGSGNTGASSIEWVVGGWNGGGSTYTQSRPVGSGGGSTDICLTKSEVTLTSSQTYERTSNSLLSRIIVAGGGGGGGQQSFSGNGLSGGGTQGMSNKSEANGVISVTSFKEVVPIGGSQISGGQTCVYQSDEVANSRAGIFGCGGVYYARETNNSSTGAGGGGWFGGGTQNHQGGGGGSGYVLTETSYKPSEYTPTSNYYMTDDILIAGDSEMPSPSRNTQIGQEGNGYCIITCLELFSTVNAKCKIDGQIKQVSDMKVKVNGTWENITKTLTKINGIWK
ncbi:glycine rich domain-containing protein [Metaclostridioides mangenotii]|uniref:glycine rich domain-containing protein n=1 Tax=Metaclostridioides mangenotii TaxID=1540 RepID=UPI00068B8E95|nr:glycine rich domain-containing protein [Clostridioides mangenotii]